jgi:hypothetical protein
VSRPALISLVLALAACHPSAQPAPEPCPLRTAADWQAFLDRWANDPRWVATCESGGCDTAFRAAVEGEVAALLDRCGAAISVDPGLAACTEHLRAFTPVWLRQHDDRSYGFDLDNRAYFAHGTAAGRAPGLMRLPEALLAALPDLAAVKAAAGEQGWRWVIQESCQGGPALFLLISDRAVAFDQWILVNLSGDAPALRVDTDKPLSFLGVERLDTEGHPLPRVRVDFRDFTLSATRGAPLEPADTATKCYACHPTGPRALIERRTPFLAASPVRGDPSFANPHPPADFAFTRLLQLRARLLSYGIPDWHGTLTPEALGPAMGVEEGCAPCHDDQVRGRLTTFFSEAQLEDKVRHELSMPPDPAVTRLLERREMANPPLNAADRRALERAYDDHRRLAAAFLGGRSEALARWLTDTACR